MHADGDCWQVVEGVLTKDMATEAKAQHYKNGVGGVPS